MKKSHRLYWVLICALTLTGCDDSFVSQTPLMSEFTDKSPTWIYQQAENAKLDRQYNKAISNFKAFIMLHSDHKQVEQARLGLIDCYTARGQLEAALLEIDNFLRLHSDSTHCISLESKKERLKYKQKMDWLYHIAWTQDVQNNNKTNYRALARVVDVFSE